MFLFLGGGVSKASKATIDLMNECVTIRPEEMKRLKCELEIQEKKLKKKKLMSSAWMLH